MIERYLALGYHIEPNLVPADLCHELVITALGSRLLSDPFAPLIMPHREREIFLSMLHYPPITMMARQLIGNKISGLGTEYFYGAPGTKGFLPHQDNIYVQAPEGEFIHAWTALVDVGRDNGCMQFWPGSHMRGLLPTEDTGELAGTGQNINARAVRTIVPDDLSPVDIVLKRGSTVFFDSLLVHSSHDNHSVKYRHSLLCTYIRKGAQFNPGKKQKRTEVEL